MKPRFLPALLLAVAVAAGGCSKKQPEDTAKGEPTEADMQAVRVYFLQEWNKRFTECNNYYYTKSEHPSLIFLGMKTSPDRFAYEWKPTTGTDDMRHVIRRCSVFPSTETSMVYADSAWFRPFKKGAGYLVANDIANEYPGAEARTTRNDYLETQCDQFLECVGFDILVYADGSMEVVDEGRYWEQLRKPVNCAEIPR